MSAGGGGEGEGDCRAVFGLGFEAAEAVPADFLVLGAGALAAR